MAANSRLEQRDWPQSGVALDEIEPDQAAPRGRLARLGDLVLRLLDQYVRWMGLEAPEAQAPPPPVMGTPYRGYPSEAFIYQRGSRYFWRKH